jgi:hypothetical protein
MIKRYTTLHKYLYTITIMLYHNTKMVQENMIAVKVDEETKEKIRSYSKYTHRSMSGTIKHALANLWVSEPIKEPQEQTNGKE